MSSVAKGSVKESAKKSQGAQPLSADEVRKMDAYWRACNYLCVGMLYLLENPLLREPLEAGAY